MKTDKERVEELTEMIGLYLENEDLCISDAVDILMNSVNALLTFALKEDYQQISKVFFIGFMNNLKKEQEVVF